MNLFVPLFVFFLSALTCLCFLLHDWCTTLSWTRSQCRQTHQGAKWLKRPLPVGLSLCMCLYIWKTGGGYTTRSCSWLINWAISWLLKSGGFHVSLVFYPSITSLGFGCSYKPYGICSPQSNPSWLDWISLTLQKKHLCISRCVCMW